MPTELSHCGLSIAVKGLHCHCQMKLCQGDWTASELCVRILVYQICTQVIGQAGDHETNRSLCVLMKLTYIKVVETSIPLLCSTHGTVEWYKTLVHGSVEDQLRLVLMYLRVCHCRSHSGNCAAGYMLVTMFMRCMKHCICSPDFAYVKKQLDRSLWSWA